MFGFLACTLALDFSYRFTVGLKRQRGLCSTCLAYGVSSAKATAKNTLQRFQD